MSLKNSSFAYDVSRLLSTFFFRMTMINACAIDIILLSFSPRVARSINIFQVQDFFFDRCDDDWNNTLAAVFAFVSSIRHWYGQLDIFSDSRSRTRGMIVDRFRWFLNLIPIHHYPSLIHPYPPPSVLFLNFFTFS